MALLHVLPQRRNPVQGLNAGEAPADQVAPGNGAGATHATPAVEIDRPPASQLRLDMVEDAVHVFGRGNVEVADGEATVTADPVVEGTQLLLVRLQLARMGEIDEGGDSGLPQAAELPRGLLGREGARVLSGEQPTLHQPITVGQRVSHRPLRARFIGLETASGCCR